MPVQFYPADDLSDSSPIIERLETLLAAAEHYRAVTQELSKTQTGAAPAPVEKKRLTPREIGHAFNWDELAKVLRQIRELPEGNQSSKLSKAGHLAKLAEIYEVLRAAKMPKLEAVRLALVNEANQLRAGTNVT